ncbi:MAG: putative RNA methyltransferase [Pseudonocardiaceae bacterium]
MTRRPTPSVSVNARSATDRADVALAPAVVAALRCSLCGDGFAVTGRSLRCAAGHSFDIAKQGYVNLLHAKVLSGTADTAEMVAARAAFLGAGHYGPLAEAVARNAATAAGDQGLVVDAGAGTGYFLAAVLSALPMATGFAMDLSVYALRRAAKAHPRVAAAVWNIWQPLPLASESASLVLNVFAPRNGAEFRRILRSDGALIVVTPTREHLAELARVTDLLDVDPHKERRVAQTLAAHFSLATQEVCTFRLSLSAAEVRTLIGMGPNAHHLSPDDLSGIAEPVEVTASCTVAVYRPKATMR